MQAFASQSFTQELRHVTWSVPSVDPSSPSARNHLITRSYADPLWCPALHPEASPTGVQEANQQKKLTNGQTNKPVNKKAKLANNQTTDRSTTQTTKQTTKQTNKQTNKQKHAGMFSMTPTKLWQDKTRRFS